MHDRKILNKQIIISTIEIAKEAGEAITEIYNSDFNYQLKKDLSPITTADSLSPSIPWDCPMDLSREDIKVP